MLFVLKGSKTQVCKALVLYKDTAECQKGEGRSFSVPFSCPLCTYSCHFSSAVMSPPPQFLSLCCFFCGDPKTCCHKKGIASLAQFVLQKEGSFSRSPMLQLIWWEELCVLLSCPTKYFCLLIQTSHLEMAQALPKRVSFTKAVQEILTREHLFAVVTH